MFLTAEYTTVGYDFTYIFLFLGIAILSYIVQANLKRKFEQYSKMPIGMTGRDIAIKMLHDNGIYDVKVTSTPGMLTDHYNPATKTVNLRVYIIRQALQLQPSQHMSADMHCSMRMHTHRSRCARHLYLSYSSLQASCHGFCSLV